MIVPFLIIAQFNSIVGRTATGTVIVIYVRRMSASAADSEIAELSDRARKLTISAYDPDTVPYETATFALS